MIFRDWRIWFVDNFMKMSQLNRKYSSRKCSSVKKEKERIKADEKCEDLQDMFVAVTSGAGEPTKESAV